MAVNEVKHQVKLSEWKQRIAECRSSGKSVGSWCEENGYTKTTYYRWEREIFGRARELSDEKAEGLEPMQVPVTQPVLTELTVVDSPAADADAGSRGENDNFRPAAVVRVGRFEMELSNSVSPKLMRQLRELMGGC